MGMDADAVFTNYTQSVEGAVASALADRSAGDTDGVEEVAFVATKDENGFNSGVFVVRVATERDREWVRKVVGMAYEPEPRFDARFHEQRALGRALEVLGKRDRDGDGGRNVVITEKRKRALNAYERDFQRGDFVYHAAGCLAYPTRPLSECTEALKARFADGLLGQ